MIIKIISEFLYIGNEKPLHGYMAELKMSRTGPVKAC